MNKRMQPGMPVPTADTLHPRRAEKLRRAESILQTAGVVAAILHQGLVDVSRSLAWELGFVVVAAMLFLSISLWLRYRWSLARSTFLGKNKSPAIITLLWLAGILVILIFQPFFPEWNGDPISRGVAFLSWSQLCLVIRGFAGVLLGTRTAAAGGANPAKILVTSFGVLVLVGTLLLMLPRARSEAFVNEGTLAEQFQTALFTATSAGCVTGLTVVPTGGANPYWSPLGQAIILGLFQIGGLGIMTCGAFFAVLAGRHMPVRESATLREMLESDRLGDVRKLVFTILLFTLLCEIVGALLLSPLWSSMDTGEQFFYSLFHSVSAFCNAGFSLTENSFVGMGQRFEVWGVMTTLIIIGGLGFAVLYNTTLAVKSRFSDIRFQPLYYMPRSRVRLSVTSRIVLVTTTALLVVGALGYDLLESAGSSDNTHEQKSVGQRSSEAWFQSVTFRTAGFNTVDHSQMQPATKLFSIGLMFIGASPGSTGGGVKTVCFALAVLSVVSILRGRPRVEILGRTIPEVLVSRALTIMSLGMLVVMTTTMLLVLFENQPHLFLDHMFEATSAFATVGVSTGITPELTASSKMVITVTMFLGRVGPLTLLIALAGRMKEVKYDYPIERVTLG